MLVKCLCRCSPAKGFARPRVEGQRHRLKVLRRPIEFTWAAAIGMVDQAERWLLPLDGHGQGCDGQVRPHVVTHRPANDLSGGKIEHDSQIEPTFLGWDIGYVSKPDLIRPLGGEFLGEPVGGNGPILAAAGGACPEPARRYFLDTVMTHEMLQYEQPESLARWQSGSAGRQLVGFAYFGELYHKPMTSRL